jgi:crotonobetainyl-CoA:carnitine CoA-transferase CaiB-like acyl-CoA transferase
MAGDALIARAILADLLARVDADDPAGPEAPTVHITGADPVFPTVFPIGEAGAAVMSAVAVQIALLWQERTGRSQEISVAVDAAAAAMRSARYLRPDPMPEGGPRRLRGLSTYRTADGRWIYFQRLFPHHNERLSRVLGVALEEPAMSEAVGRWKAEELEEAVNAGGSTAGVVRTREEWLRLPQAAAVAARPLLDLCRVAEGPPRPVPGGKRPLSGLRVLDLTRVLAGPTCARALAEHGADVLRISLPGIPDNDGMMKDTGHGKRSVELDLKDSGGAAALRELAAGADVVVQGYRPGALEALGFGVAELVALNPSLVVVELSAYGGSGPWGARRGFDSVVQSVNGLVVANSGAEGTSGPPTYLPANPLDYLTGYLAAFGVLAALRRRACGGAYHLRMSLARTGEWLWSLPRLDAETASLCPAELPAERLAELFMVRQTPFGGLKFLAPAVRLSLTAGRWELPTPRPDQDTATWLAR